MADVVDIIYAFCVCVLIKLIA